MFVIIKKNIPQWSYTNSRKCPMNESQKWLKITASWILSHDWISKMKKKVYIWLRSLILAKMKSAFTKQNLFSNLKSSRWCDVTGNVQGKSQITLTQFKIKDGIWLVQIEGTKCLRLPKCKSHFDWSRWKVIFLPGWTWVVYFDWKNVKTFWFRIGKSDKIAYIHFLGWFEMFNLQEK